MIVDAIPRPYQSWLDVGDTLQCRKERCPQEIAPHRRILDRDDGGLAALMYCIAGCCQLNKGSRADECNATKIKDTRSGRDKWVVAAQEVVECSCIQFG